MLKPGTSTLSSDPPCGLYIHVPFCTSKCGYCDFYSVALQGRDPAPLVRSIVKELAWRVEERPYQIKSVFIGGGTPTVLPQDQLRHLLDAVARTVKLDDITEYTVEANPATVDDSKAAILVDAGVTRVSMGAQSFLPSELATLERLHSPQDIAPSVETLRRRHVRRINIDLIFGIPGQTLQTLGETLARGIELNVDHVAAYGLMYEPGTRLTAQRNLGHISPCDEKIEAQMYTLARDRLTAAGFEQYEISNYAKPGCRCTHNMIYWRNQPYIGVGPSAVGCLQRRRYRNVPSISRYVELIENGGCAEIESEFLDDATAMLELILMQLRLVEGLSRSAFQAETGIDPFALFAPCLPRLISLGLIAVSDTHFALTERGRLVSDAVMAELAAQCPDSGPPSAKIEAEIAGYAGRRPSIAHMLTHHNSGKTPAERSTVKLKVI